MDGYLTWLQVLAAVVILGIFAGLTEWGYRAQTMSLRTWAFRTAVTGVICGVLAFLWWSWVWTG